MLEAGGKRDKIGCPCCSFDLFLPPPHPEPPTSVVNSALATVCDDDNDEPISPEAAAVCIAASSSIDVIVDTHGHAQLARDNNDNKLYIMNKEISGSIKLKSITCSVAPGDWKTTLDYASKSDWILPALGIHPWYLDGLPENYLEELEILLKQHPSAIVGEIGLCKMARFIRQHPEGKSVALDIQRSVFKNQMILAAKLRRPVSVHCVNQHGVFVSVTKDLLAGTRQDDDDDAIPPCQRLPPAIAMHSFTGTAHHVKELLRLESELCMEGPLFYFGFSHTVNYVMCSSRKAKCKGRDAACEVPLDRLLVESDVHAADDLIGGTAGAIAYVAWARNSKIEDIAECTSRNGLAFASSGFPDEKKDLPIIES